MKRRYIANIHIQQLTVYTLLFPLIFSVNIAEAKEIIGIYEKIKINSVGLIFKAKIDTGAKNSSLNIRDIHLAQRKGKIWVKFQITDKDGKSALLDKPLERFAKIKRKNASTQQRPVVMLDVCLGGIQKKVEVNLVDRSNFNYQMLIGRSFINGDFIVDVDKSYTTKPHC